MRFSIPATVAEEGSGTTSIEYGVIAAAVPVAAIGGLTAAGG